MLLLSRRAGEEIVITDNATGEQIVVVPTALQGNQVRIGIAASKARYSILRKEVQERDRSAALT